MTDGRAVDITVHAKSLKDGPEWLRPLCRVLALHAVYTAHPHLLHGMPPRGPSEDEDSLRARADRVAEALERYGTASSDQG